MARYKPGHAYTLPVVTLNYRPPELLLGCRHYGPPIDVWSVGAIFAELLKREIVITGRDEGDYLQKLYALCGTPREVDWPEARKVCKHWREACGVRGVRGQGHDGPLSRRGVGATPAPRPGAFGEKSRAAKLLDRLLAFSPKKRVTAKDALGRRLLLGGGAAFRRRPFFTLGRRSRVGVARRHAAVAGARARRRRPSSSRRLSH